MSKLQNIAKPSLLPLILNADWSGLTIGDLKSIASWVAMTCAVNEYADPPTVSIPQEDRTYLMARLEPPSERWTIWMGRFEGAADRDFWHSGLCYWPLDDTHPGVHDDEKGQLTTFRLGRLIFCTLSVPRMILIDDRDESMMVNGFARIWPLPSNPVKTMWALSDDDAYNFHNGFKKSIAASRFGF